MPTLERSRSTVPSGLGSRGVRFSSPTRQHRYNSASSNAWGRIADFVSGSWTGSEFPQVPILWRNESTKPPQNLPWIECDIVWGPGKRDTIESNIVQGTFVAQIFIPKGIGIASSS